MNFGNNKFKKVFISASILAVVFLSVNQNVKAQITSTDFENSFLKEYNGTLNHTDWNKLLGLSTTTNSVISGSEPSGFFLNTLYPGTTKGQLGINVSPGTGTETSLKIKSFGNNILGLFSSTDSEVFTVLDSGNIGVGKIDPDYKLSVNGDIQSDVYRSLIYPSLSFIDYENDDFTSNGVLMTSASEMVFVADSNDNGSDLYGFRFVEGGLTTGTSNELMRIQKNGNIGIGTDSPITKLHIIGGGSAIARNDTMSFDNDYDLINKGYLDSVLPGVSSTGFWEGSLTGDINSANSGNVGIGIINPSQKLDVIGNINIDSTSAYLFDENIALRLSKNGEAEYYSTLVGHNSGNSTDPSSTRQTTLGYEAGDLNTGNSQTALGFYSGYENTGNNQTSLGYLAGYQNAGSDQVSLGYYSGYLNTGFNQIALGTFAGASNTRNNQIAVGYYAGNLSTGESQIALGYFAGYQNTGDNVVGVGYEASMNNTASNVVAIGYQAGKNNTNANQFIVKQNNINTVPLIQGDFSSGNIGIGTDSPITKLHIIGGGSAIARNDTMSFDNDYDLINKGYLDSVLPGVSSTGFWEGSLTGDINSANSGNIGIGTDTPDSVLHVYTSVGTDIANFQSYGTGGGAAGIAIKASANTIIFDTSTASDNIAFSNLGTETLRINSSGNVGIGTNNPLNKIHIEADNTDVGLTLTETGLRSWTMGTDFSNSNRLTFGYSSTVGASPVMTMSEIGNIGIGNTNPQYGRLEVTSILGNNGTGISLYSGTGLSARSWLGSSGEWHLSRGGTAANGISILSSGYVGVLGINPIAPFEVMSGSHARNSTMSYSGNDYDLINYGYLETVMGDSAFWQGDLSGDIRNGNTANVGIGADAISTAKLNIGGSLSATGASLSGQLSMTGSGVDANITGVNKLTVYTIDPLYNINGVNYSTYASAIVGGVKEEYLGKLKIDKVVEINGVKQYEGEINFSTVSEGSDAWVWYQVVDFNKEHVDVSYIPYGDFASVYYIILDDKIIFRADKEAEISFRITGSRHDWKKWPTIAIDQSEEGWKVERE